MSTSDLPMTTIPRRRKLPPVRPIPVASDQDCCPHCQGVLATHRTDKGEVVGKSCLKCGATWEAEVKHAGNENR